MDYRRAVVPGVVVVIVVTAVVFGPLVSGISLASDDGPVVAGEGTLTIASASFPSTATIEPADYGAANYYLTVPPTTVEFGSIDGNTALVYTIEIEGLGLQRSTAHYLDSSYGPTFEATMSSGTLTDSEFDRSQYPATLSLAARNASDYRVLEERNVTVEVTE